MNREEKSATIQEIAAQIEGAEAIFAVDYRGISVPQAAELRGKLRETDSSFRIVKNRLTKLAADAGGRGAARRAAGRADRADLRPRRHRRGGESDHHLQQNARRPHLQGRLHGRDRARRGGFKSIAHLPSREVLIGQFAGDRRQPADRHRPRPERADPGPRHAARPDRRPGPGHRRGSGGRRAAEEPAAEEAAPPRSRTGRLEARARRHADLAGARARLPPNATAEETPQAPAEAPAEERQS